MSTLDPLESKQCPDECQTGFNRLRCYAAKTWCKALKVFEPLCALREVDFSRFEHKQVAHIFYDSLIRFEKSKQVISEYLTILPLTRADYSQWLDLAKKHSLTFSADEERLARGQLTGFNIVEIGRAHV